MMEEEGGDPDMGEALVLVTAIIMLRGSSMCLGTMNLHYPSSVWLDYARNFLHSHGEQFPVGATIPLDVRPHAMAWGRRGTLPRSPKSLSFMSLDGGDDDDDAA